jgi:hypothetical protein
VSIIGANPIKYQLISCTNISIFHSKLNTFDNIEAPKSTAAELSDGVAMCQCLAAM